MRTRVKICGITSARIAQVAAHAGADAIGLVFYSKSVRNVSIKTALKITSALPAFVNRVALFVDANSQFIEEVCKTVPIDTIQFHGHETPDYCASFAMPYIKAIRMKEDTNLHQELEHYKEAASVLLDSYKPGQPGGTGEVFNWEMIPSDIAAEIILAGGLNPDNIAQAIEQVRPWAVDVSGGLEQAPGRKDPEAIYEFMRNVQK